MQRGFRSSAAKRYATIASAVGCALLMTQAIAERTGANIEEIIVSEPARLHDSAIIPGGVTVVEGDALRERNVASLADLLRFVPGVWSTSATGNDNIFFSSRGSNLDSVHYDFNGIKLLQDGLPVTAADGNNHNRFVDPLSARYATVARGANAMQYGASTLGGAIDFATPTARDGARQELYFNGGSHGHAQLRGTFGSMLGENADMLVTLERKQWDGYRDHNRQDRSGVYANVGWQLSDTASTRLYATFIRNDQELAGVLTRAQYESEPNMAEPSAVSGNYRFDVESARLASKTTFDLGNDRSFELGFSLEEQSLFHPIVDRIMVPIGGVPTEVFSLLIDTEQRNLGTMMRYRQRVGDHDLIVGVNYADSTVKGGDYRNLAGQANGLTTIIDNTADSLEIYLMDRWQVSSRWMIELAAQGVRAQRDVRNTAVATGELRHPEGRYSRVNPRVGFIRTVGSGIDVYGNVSSLYEPPTNYQLEDEATGSHAALDAMHGTVFEIGLRGEHVSARSGLVAWDIALYHAAIRDEIVSIDDPLAPGTSLSSNVDRTIHAGLEAIVRAEWPVGSRGAAIAPVVSVTVNDFSFDGDEVYGNGRLPAAPRYVVRGEALYRLPNGVFVGPTFDVVDERFADFMNTYRIDAYSLVGLRAGWANERWRVFGELRNATGERYVATHNVVDVGASNAAMLNPGEPRSVYFGVQTQF